MHPNNDYVVDSNDDMMYQLQLPFEIATCESTTFSPEIATVAVIIKLRTTLGKFGEFWAHIAIFWLA